MRERYAESLLYRYFMKGVNGLSERSRNSYFLKVLALDGGYILAADEVAEKKSPHRILAYWYRSLTYQLLSFLFIGFQSDEAPMGNLYTRFLKGILFLMIALMPAMLFHRMGHLPLLFAGLFLLGWTKKRFPVHRTALLATGFLMIMIGLSTFFSLDRYQSSLYFSAFLFFFSVFLFVLAYFNERDIHLATSLIVASTTLVSLLGIYQYFFTEMAQLASWVDLELNPNLSARAYGTFGDPNTFATFLIPIIFFGLLHMVNSSSYWRKGLFFLATSVNLLAFLMTFSRSNWIGFFVAMLVFLLLCAPKSVPFFAAIGLVSVLFMPDVILDRIWSIFLFSSDSSMRYREAIWSASAHMASDFWRSGIGLGYQTYAVLSTQYHWGGVFSIHAHNLYLQWLIETGIWGLFALLMLILTTLTCALKRFHTMETQSKRWVSVLVAILSSYFITGIVDYNLLYMRNMFMMWFALSLLWVVIRMEDHKEEKRG